MRNEQARLRASLLGLLFIVFSAFIVGCRTYPASVDTSKTDILQTEVFETQTAVTQEATELSGTIDQIKTITDDAKGGIISPEKTVTLIKYVDLSVKQKDIQLATILQLNKQIANYSKSRISDNLSFSLQLTDKEKQLQAEKKTASNRLKWATIASFIALVLACILFLPKMIKFII